LMPRLYGGDVTITSTDFAGRALIPATQSEAVSSYLQLLAATAAIIVD